MGQARKRTWLSLSDLLLTPEVAIHAQEAVPRRAPWRRPSGTPTWGRRVWFALAPAAASATVCGAQARFLGSLLGAEPASEGTQLRQALRGHLLRLELKLLQAPHLSGPCVARTKPNGRARTATVPYESAQANSRKEVPHPNLNPRKQADGKQRSTPGPGAPDHDFLSAQNFKTASPKPTHEAHGKSHALSL